MIMNIKQWKIQIEPKTKLNYNIYHQLTIHNSSDSEDDFCSGCRNVSHCQQQQFFTELY